VRQLIGRVVNTIVRWGEEGGYFADKASRDAFKDELAHLLVEQKMAFNSPVWFNVGRAGEAAMLGVLYQFRGGQHGFDHESGEDGRDAVQVGLGHGDEFFDAAGK